MASNNKKYLKKYIFEFYIDNIMDINILLYRNDNKHNYIAVFIKQKQ